MSVLNGVDTHNFEFDNVFGCDSTQQRLYGEVLRSNLMEILHAFLMLDLSDKQLCAQGSFPWDAFFMSIRVDFWTPGTATDSSRGERNTLSHFLSQALRHVLKLRCDVLEWC